MTVITPCRPAEPHEIPKSAKALAATATANGWDVEVTYAQSEHHIAASNGRVAYVTKRGTTVRALPPRAAYTKRVDSIAVRMWRETRLAGIWTDGLFETGLAPFRRFDSDTLHRLVTMSRAELAKYAQELTEQAAA